jgi:leucyl-tRNA synthetase
MDTFVDSSWYFLRYLSPKEKTEAFSKSLVKKIMPVDVYVGGAEHAVLHLLYARFIAKALADAKFIPYPEPFLKLRNVGLVLADDGQKMSKSRGNVIGPDEVIEEYGADTAPWNTRSMIGIFRFLTRVWNLGEELSKKSKREKIEESKVLRRLTHQTISKVEKDITSFGFNTAVSALMIFLSEIEKEKSLPAFRTFLLLLYPFAPHLTSELWTLLKFGKDISKEPWPEVIEQYLRASEISLVVQINGKVRDTLMLPAGMSEEELVEAARSSAKVAAHLTQSVVRTVVVPEKLVNFVTK